MDRSVFKKPKTLCWDCANAVPDKRGHGCSWSRDLIPVKGWVATKGQYNQSSYRVEKCPEFVVDASPSKVPISTLEIPNEPEEPPPKKVPTRAPEDWDGTITFEDEADRMTMLMAYWGLGGSL